MKKTWTTRILIALMTLAVLVSAVAMTPKGALAENELTVSATPVAGTAGEVYAGFSVSVTAGGTTGETYTYAVTTGSLPDGLSLNESSGAVSGTPTAAGSYPVSFTATESNTGYTGTASSTIEIAAAQPADTTTTETTPTTTTTGTTPTTTTGTTPTTTTTGTTPTTTTTTETTPTTTTTGTTPTTTTTGTTPTTTTTGTTPTTTTTGTTPTTTTGTTPTTTETGTTGTTATTPTETEKKITISSPSGSSRDATTRDEIVLRATGQPGEVLTWVMNPLSAGYGTFEDLGGGNAVYTPDRKQDLGVTVKFKCTGNISPVAEAVTVYFKNDDRITSPSNETMTFTTATAFDSKTFTVSSEWGGDLTISNSNPKIALVKVNGHEVGLTPITVQSGSQVTVQALYYGRTYINILPVHGISNDGRCVTVYVGAQTPTLDVQFWSCDYCTTTLSKVNNWGTLKITVDNYNPAYPYVTVTRSNIRTYIQGGSYYTHPSTYTYTAALQQSLTDPLQATASLYIIPQYNGSTYYTVSYTGAVSKNSPTIYVVGFTTLPQTGPNYTWAYILGGLCLATVATAVTLNVRKKKRENI